MAEAIAFPWSPARRLVPAKAFGSEWDATSDELEDALTDIAGEVGRTAATK